MRPGAACTTRLVDARSRPSASCQGGHDEALLCARCLLTLAPYRDARGGRQLRPGAGQQSGKENQGGADYWTINGKGQVPVLEFDNGERLTEGPVIVQWIVDQYPAAGLVPAAGKPERYRVQEWLNFITSELHKSFGPIFRPTTPDAYKAISKENLGKRFDWLDKQPDGRQIHGRRCLPVHGAALDRAHRHGPRQVAQPQGLCRPRRRAPQGAGSAQG